MEAPIHLSPLLPPNQPQVLLSLFRDITEVFKWSGFHFKCVEQTLIFGLSKLYLVQFSCFSVNTVEVEAFSYSVLIFEKWWVCLQKLVFCFVLFSPRRVNVSICE